MSHGPEKEKVGTHSTLDGAHMEPGADFIPPGRDRVPSFGRGRKRDLGGMGGAEFACCFRDRVGPGLALGTPGGLDLAGGAGPASDRVFDHG